MIQVYSPKIDTPATRGWCLKYIDDAGNAPARTATARYSWQVERDAGRIRTSELPDNVWVVGWLDFTAGAYTTYGHVFFIKQTSGSYQIYDSEVQSGARRPYKSIDEILAWFGMYGPIYLGWSTNCDGRQYAKEDTMKEEDAKRFRNPIRVVNSEAKGWDRTKVHNGDYDAREIEYLRSLNPDPIAAFVHYSQQGWDEGHSYRNLKDKWRKDSEVVLPAVTKERDALKKEVEELKKQGEFIKITDLYMKK